MDQPGNTEKPKQTNNPEVKKEKEKKRGGVLFIILAVVFLITSGILGYLLNDTTGELKQSTEKNEAYAVQVNELEGELDAKIAELMELKGENADLDARIQEKIEELEEMKVQLAAAQNKAAKVDELKGRLWVNEKKYDMLKDERDSLVVANEALTEENIATKKTLSEKESEVQSLTSKTNDLSQQVAKGKLLTAFSLEGTGVKIRNSGKEKETDKASRADAIRACFTLSENRIAESGDKEIFLVVKNPTGVPFSKGESTTFTSAEGEDILYSDVQNVNYQNEAESLCLYWESKSEDGFAPGKYEIEIWADKSKIGSTKVTLE